MHGLTANNILHPEIQSLILINLKLFFVNDKDSDPLPDISEGLLTILEEPLECSLNKIHIIEKRLIDLFNNSLFPLLIRLERYFDLLIQKPLHISMAGTTKD